jgi:hypothetical protein
LTNNIYFHFIYNTFIGIAHEISGR